MNQRAAGVTFLCAAALMYLVNNLQWSNGLSIVRYSGSITFVIFCLIVVGVVFLSAGRNDR